MILISVVVPAYNIDKYLSMCLDSVINQTFFNWELILVDDGSTDNTPYIADNYARQYSQIKVIHKENGGVSSARNIGLVNAVGEWITFIDGDDCISKDFFTIFANLLSDENFDLFMGDVEEIDTDGHSFVEYGLQNCNVSTKEALVQHKILRSGDLHGKFFKMNIIKKRNLQFSEQINYAEDGLFLDKYLSFCKQVYFSSKIVYSYKRNTNGLSFKLNSFESEYLCYRELKKVLSHIAQKYNLSVQDLLHKTPMLRTLRSLMLNGSYKDFLYWNRQLDNIDLFFLYGSLEIFRISQLLKKLHQKKAVFLFYLCLKTYLRMNKWIHK